MMMHLKSFHSNSKDSLRCTDRGFNFKFSATQNFSPPELLSKISCTPIAF